MTQRDREYLDFANYLAWKGYGCTEPNPMVGAVLVHNNRIIGQGWHEQYGAAHAEVNCVLSVSDGDKRFIRESTMYVSLEPCNHHGKTPPCTHLIAESGIRRVVIGYQDVYEKVNGSGIRYLKGKGVEVECCQYLPSHEINRHFFTAHQMKRPFITLKWAETLDGYIGTGNTDRVVLSGKEVQDWVHFQRMGHQSILVGAQTIINDNPVLNVRNMSVEDRLIKVIWDRDGILTAAYRVFDSGNQVFLFTVNPELKERFSLHTHVDVLVINGHDFLREVLEILYSRNVISVYVEGGQQVLNTFIQNGVFDEIQRIVTNSMYLNMTIPAPQLSHPIEFKESFNLGNDTVKILRKRNE